MTQEKSVGFGKWLAEHPGLKVLGSLIAIIGGLIGILTFATGATTLPDFLALLSGKYYDRFEKSEYDGEYDTSLWTVYGINGVLIEQRDSALVIQPTDVKEDGNIALIPNKKGTIPFDKFTAFEAELKMDGDVHGLGFIKTQMYSIVNEESWWLECQLAIHEVASPIYFCNVYEGLVDSNDDIVYSYETEHIPVEYNKWYRSRMELDSDKNIVRFYLNNRLVGKFTFSNQGALYFSSLSPQIGSWVTTSDKFVGYYDNIKIESNP